MASLRAFSPSTGSVWLNPLLVVSFVSFILKAPFRVHLLEPSFVLSNVRDLGFGRWLGKRPEFKRCRMFLWTRQEVSSIRPLLFVAADDTKAADDASHLRNAGSTFGVTKAQVSARPT